MQLEEGHGGSAKVVLPSICGWTVKNGETSRVFNSTCPSHGMGNPSVTPPSHRHVSFGMSSQPHPTDGAKYLAWTVLMRYLSVARELIEMLLMLCLPQILGCQFV